MRCGRLAAIAFWLQSTRPAGPVAEDVKRPRLGSLGHKRTMKREGSLKHCPVCRATLAMPTSPYGETHCPRACMFLDFHWFSAERSSILWGMNSASESLPRHLGVLRERMLHPKRT